MYPKFSGGCAPGPPRRARFARRWPSARCATRTLLANDSLHSSVATPKNSLLDPPLASMLRFVQPWQKFLEGMLGDFQRLIPGGKSDLKGKIINYVILFMYFFIYTLYNIIFEFLFLLSWQNTEFINKVLNSSIKLHNMKICRP